MGHIAIVLALSLLMVANSDEASQQYRTLFDFPADALSVNDLEGQEAEQLPNVQKFSGSVSQSGDQLENLRRSIPGEPDVDYPIFRSPPDTAFSCNSRALGYYADVEARCQVFRVCTNTDLTGRGFAFLCPNGTLFNQEVFVCDWYQHVDCAASENHYGKNVELKMNISSMSDMMAVVNEMMNFPLKQNATRPTIFPTLQTTTTQRVTQRPPIVTSPFPISGQNTKNPNQFTFQPSSTFPTATKPNQFGNGVTAPSKQTETQTQVTTAQPTSAPTPASTPGTGTGQRTITQEGDFEINSNTGVDQINTNKQTIESNQPIFISSLGELSTDVGNKFDINKAKIIKPDENNPFSLAPDPIRQQANDQVKQSLTESFQNRQNGNEAVASTASDNLLLQGLQQVLQQNPDAMSGEADLIEFIKRILQRNPDLTADQLNGILSAESDAILNILNDSVNRNLNGLPKQGGKTDLLDSIQGILNKYKSNPVALNTPTTQQVLVFSGEADLLSQTIQRILQQSQIPIFSGEADLVEFIERLKKQNPDFTKEQLTAIISGEADSILRFLNERRQKNNGLAISTGEADLLEAIQLVLQKYRNNGAVQQQSTPQFGSMAQNQPGQSIVSITGKNRLPQPSQQLLAPSAAPAAQQLVNQQNDARDSSNIASINPNANQNPTQINAAKPVSSITSNQQESPISNQNAKLQFGLSAIESGEADLIQILRQILLRIPNQRAKIFSGEADLLQFIELIKQQNPDLTTNQINAIISGEANSILRILNGKAQRNKVNGFPVLSGEADLLEAIQLVIQKYRQNNKTLPPLPEPVFSGEGDLLETLQRIQDQISIPILSGEADLLQFIRRIEQRNPELTPGQLHEIISGEIDSILRIFNERRQQSGSQAVFSGEADLLEAIQIVIDKSRGNTQTRTSPVTSTVTAPISSGESDLLQTIKRLSQQSSIPISSGEADLIQFIERIQQQNPEFSKEQLNAIISGEADSILQILDQKAKSNTGIIAVSSGEADLLEAIQIVLQKYKNTATPQTSQTAVNSGESDLLQTLRQIKQQSSVKLFSSGESDLVQFSQRLQQRNPTLSPGQLSSIISRQLDSILTYLTDKTEKDPFSNFADYSGEDDLLVAVQYYVEQYAKPDGATIEPIQSVPVQSGESDLLQALQRIQQQSSIPIFSGAADLVQFIQLIKERNPDFTSDQLTAIISGEADSILQILNGKVQKKQSSGIAVLSGEADLLEAIQLVIQKYRSKSIPSPTLGQTIPSQPQATRPPLQAVSTSPQLAPVQSGENDLLQTIQNIRQQISIPVFSGEADLVQFIELIKERNPDFTPSQLNAIISGEANSISQILNAKTQKNQSNGVRVISGEADLLEAIQLVIQKYRSKSVPSPSPTRGQTVQAQTVRPQSQPASVQSGESDLLQTIQNIRQQISIPVFSGEADLVQFIELIKQRNPDFTPSQLNAIISGEANSISQILNAKVQKNQSSGIAVLSGEADLLEAVQLVIQKYRSKSVPSSNQSQTVSSQQPQLPIQPQLVPVQSGDSDLQTALRNIQQQISVPIFSGEADLVQFIELVKKQNPEFTQNQLGSIISGEANSIVHILNEKRQNSGSSTVDVSSGDADLLQSIFQVLKKYRRNYQSTPTFLSTQYGPPNQVQNAAYQSPPSVPSTTNSQSVRGQVTAISSGQTNAFYQYSNQNQGNVGVSGKATLSVEQNKQSQFSNQRSQSTQRQITKNVYRGQDNIYTKTAISHQTRSQSTSTNSEKFHYKITQTIPYQQPIPVQQIQSTVTSTIAPNTYIPPYPTRSSYHYTPTPASKQVFTYPSETEARRQSGNVNIATHSINYQHQSYNKQIEPLAPPSLSSPPAAAQQAYVYTEIVNRPPVNPDIPHPPLQTVYPESIQNKVESRVVNRPALIRQYSSPSIPSSLPSIVHEPSNTVATIQNVPSAYSSSYAQTYASPVITSTYSNREIYSHANSNAREKVVVKVVKAPGWYLNDANERRSYYDAVAHGLLSENGLVYVNNVQKENTQLAQNVPITAVGASSSSSSVNPPTSAYLPKSNSAIPPAQLQAQPPYTPGTVQPFNGINYCPCAYSQSTQVPHSQQIPVQSRQLSYTKRSAIAGDLYSGRSSYNVESHSVGRLVGDNLKYQYNLSSLRQPPQSQPQTQSQPTQRHRQ